MNNIVELYRVGKTISQIAATSNKDLEQVKEELWQHREQIEYRDGVFRNVPKSVKLDLINEYEISSLYKMEKKYGISMETLQRYFISKNIKIKPSHQNKYDNLRQIPFTQRQKEVIVGGVLGDFSLRSTNSQFSLDFNHCQKQKQYFDDKINLLAPFIIDVRNFQDPRTNYWYWRGRTCQHPDLTYFGKLFYPTTQKSVPEGLGPYFTPLALAIWLQDDWYLTKNNRYDIASHSFGESGNIRLQKYLKDCLDINAKLETSKVHKKIDGKYIVDTTRINYKLRLPRQEAIKVYYLVKDYISEDMKYKINITNFSLNSKPRLKEKIIIHYSDQDLLDMYLDGAKINSIAGKTHLSKEEVYQRLAKQTKMRRRYLQYLNEEQKNEIRKFYQETKNLESTIQKFGGGTKNMKKILGID